MLAMLLCTSLAMAQSKFNVKGIIIDKETDEALIAASVQLTKEDGTYVTGKATDMNGDTVDQVGTMDETAMQQTLDLAKKYIALDDATAQKKLQSLTLDDIRDTSFFDAAMKADGKSFKPEKTDVSIQLKWLPQSQFMGYYVAQAKGYYKEVGLNVNIISGGGDVAETTAVNNGTVDFGVTWVSNLAAADAGGMDLVEIAQIFQRSGLELVYKPENFQ